MGKIRVKTFDDAEQEAKDKRLLAKRAAKKDAKLAEKEPKADITETAAEEPVTEQKAEEEVKTEAKSKPKKAKKVQIAFHSKKYDQLLETVDASKIYSLKEALELLPKLSRGKFDETVELHLNTLSTGITGSITLPHGTGKQTKVVIADDAVIAQIEKGKIDFDILVAVPAMMPKLAKVARVLGPRGLMPNPKNGTITDNPEAVAKKYAGGQLNFKTEAKSPIMHLTVGKVSFGTDKLTDNIEAMLAAVKKANIVNATLKSTMSPGIKIKV